MIMNGDAINWGQIIKSLKETGYREYPQKVQIRIPNARNNLEAVLKYLCGKNTVWNDNYDKIAKWLTDNKGKGLMLAGECGVGKTLIGMRIIPLLINYFCGSIVTICTANELNKTPDEILSKHIIYIDDVGIEEVSNIYGNKRLVFAELVDEAEKKGKLLIFSTNLDDNALLRKYGDRTVDRLHAIVRKINIKGTSYRK